MVLSKEDRILIKNLNFFKGYCAKKLISEFPAKGCKKTTVNDFLKCLKETGSTTQKSGSGRPRTVQTVANISAVNDLVPSKEDTPQTHRTTSQIARESIHPSFICCTNNSRWVTSEMRQETPCTEADWGQLHHPFESREEAVEKNQGLRLSLSKIHWRC